MSGRRRSNQLPDKLPQLQNLIKRDPESYKEEFTQQYAHFRANLKLFRFNPHQECKPIQELVMFLSQVCPCYPAETAEYPLELMSLLREYPHVMEPDMRMTLCKGLMTLRAKGSVDAISVLELFFELFCVQDKILRKTLYLFIVSDLKRVNKKHKNHKINKALQNFMFKMVQDSSPVSAKLSLDVIIELYHKMIWNEPKTVNIVVSACFSKITKIMVASLTFFLGRDDDTSGQQRRKRNDSSDSSDSEPEVTSDKVKRMLLKVKVKKQTKRKEIKARKAIKLLRIKNKKSKKKRTKREGEAVFTGLHLINDPQDFAEKLFKRLQRSKEKFEVKLLMMNVISKMIGVHQLLLLNFYPYLQRYLQFHQKDVTKVLVYLAQSCHDLVPPEVIAPCIKAVTDNFITERNASEVMAVGLNTIREVSLRCPLVMSSELLDDLVEYKDHKDRSVVMAARSLIQAFRQINPDLLHKKDRGRPTELENEKPKEYGENRPASFVPGMELLRVDKMDTGVEPADGSDITDTDCSDDGGDDDDGDDDVDIDDGDDGSDDGDDDDGSDDGDDDDEDDSDEDCEGDIEGVDDSDSDGHVHFDGVNSSSQISPDGGDGDGDNDDAMSGTHNTPKSATGMDKSTAKAIIEQDAQKRKEKATEVCQSRFLTDEDFERIRREQVLKKREPLKSRKRKAQDILEQDLDEEDDDEDEEERGEFVTLRDIAFVHKRKKFSKEERHELVMNGRKDRKKYGFDKRRQNPYASTTNQEKSKKKAFAMVIQKGTIKRKEKRSFREKQIDLRNALVRRQKSKKGG